MSSRSHNAFYRVHHADAYTIWDPSYGFSNPHPDLLGHISPTHFLNKHTLEAHTAGTKTSPSPFISLFSSYERACDLAQTYRAKGYREVAIAQITTCLDAILIQLDFHSGTIWLPAWLGEGGMVFVSTPAVRKVLGVEEGRSDVDEWFAVDWVSAVCVSGVEDETFAAVETEVSG